MSRGRIRHIAGTDPAAGAQISEAVPAGAIWRLLTFCFRLITSATAANRSIRLEVTNATGQVDWVAGSNFTHVASTTIDYRAGASGIMGQTTTQGTLQHAIPLPVRLLLPPGSLIQTAASNFQAGDDYSLVRYLVEEWA